MKRGETMNVGVREGDAALDKMTARGTAVEDDYQPS